jgi:hypothetical protein
MDTTEYSIGASVYLLVGRRSKVIAPMLTPPPNPNINADLDDPELSNLADPTNLWITINSGTGAVTVDDNAVAPDLPGNPAATDFFAYLRAAREFARGSRQKGGR